MRPEIIREFVDKKNAFAVVGASRNPQKYGHQVYRDLKEGGYKVSPVNSNAETVLGDKCYQILEDMADKPDVVVLVVPPGVTERIVKTCNKLGITKVWMQPGSESNQAIKYCEENGIAVVRGVCIMVQRRKQQHMEAAQAMEFFKESSENLVELKAKVNSLAPLRKKMETMKAHHTGIFHQIDTYYGVPEGRLKSRETKGESKALLIYYERQDIRGPKKSRVWLLELEEPGFLKSFLNKALKKEARIDKEREIYTYKGTQIHLDTVNNLGKFIEFERPTEDTQKAVEEARGKLRALMKALEIKADMLRKGSYSDLALEESQYACQLSSLPSKVNNGFSSFSSNLESTSKDDKSVYSPTFASSSTISAFTHTMPAGPEHGNVKYNSKMEDPKYCRDLKKVAS